MSEQSIKSIIMKALTYLTFAFFLTLTVTACNAQTNKKQANKQTQNNSTDSNQTNKQMKTIIVDVRTPNEWQYDGHADCSVNMPLDQLASKIEELKAYDKVVLVCRSGARAGSAKNMLEGAGIKQVENLGPWQNVTCN